MDPIEMFQGIPDAEVIEYLAGEWLDETPVELPADPTEAELLAYFGEGE